MTSPMPPVPPGLLTELGRRAEALSISRLASPNPFVLSGNYEGVFHQLADGNAAPGVSVLWPRGDVATARSDLEGHLSPQAWASLSGAIGSAVSLFVPIAGLVAATGVASYQVLKWLRADQHSDSPFGLSVVIRELVKWAARAGPTMLLLDGIDVPERQIIWHNSYFTLANYHLEGLQIIAGVDKKLDLNAPIDSHDNTHTDPFYTMMAELAGAGVIECMLVPNLTRTAARRWLGDIEADLVAELLSQSGGQDERASAIWETWRDVGYVEVDRGGVWSRSGRTEPTLDAIHSALSELIPPAQLNLAMQTLQLASVSSPLFSGSALFDVAHNAHDVPADAVEDLVDSLTPLSGSTLPWLINTVDSRTDENGNMHWFYQFHSERHRSFLASTLGAGELQTASKALLDMAIENHGTPSIFLESAASLADQAGNTVEAEQILNLRTSNVRAAQLRARASMLLDATKAPGNPLHLFDMLLDTARELRGIGDNLMSQQVGEALVELARQSGNTADLAASTLHLGNVELELGHASVAGPLLAESVDLHRKAFQLEPSVTHRRELSTSLSSLADVKQHEAEFARARELFFEALSHMRAVYDITQQSGVQYDLAIALAVAGDRLTAIDEFDEGIELLRESVRHLRRLSAANPPPLFVRELANVLGQLGDAYTFEGSKDAAREVLEEALEIQQQVQANEPTAKNRQLLAWHLTNLARITPTSGAPDEARRLSDQAVDIRQALYDEQATSSRAWHLGVGLGISGRIYRNSGEPEQAIPMLEQAVNLFEQIGSSPKGTGLGSSAALGITLLTLARCHSDRDEWSGAVPIFDRSIEELHNAHQHLPLQRYADYLVEGLECLAKALDELDRAEEAKDARERTDRYLS